MSWRAMNRTDTSKGNKTPLDATGITSLLRNTFYVLVPVPPNCCLHLAGPNSCCLGEAPLQLPLPAAPPGLPATAQPSGPWPGSFSSLLSPLAGMLPLGSTHIPCAASPLEVCTHVGTKLPGVAEYQEWGIMEQSEALLEHTIRCWWKCFLKNYWPSAENLKNLLLSFLLLRLAAVLFSHTCILISSG